MTITPITDSVPACYGVCCPDRSSCARYAAIETVIEPLTMATCDGGDGERPRFVDLKLEAAAA